MLTAIMGLFTSFNPIILGVLLSAGAYIALRRRVVPPLHTIAERVVRSALTFGLPARPAA